MSEESVITRYVRIAEVLDKAAQKAFLTEPTPEVVALLVLAEILEERLLNLQASLPGDET